MDVSMDHPKHPGHQDVLSPLSHHPGSGVPNVGTSGPEQTLLIKRAKALLDSWAPAQRQEAADVNNGV